jgi:hypothetical protein
MTGLWLTDRDCNTTAQISRATLRRAEVSQFQGARAQRRLRLSSAIRRGADVLSDATDRHELFKR